jgi:hypothetical protein
MKAAGFRKLVLTEFPELRSDFEEWKSLPHLQVMEFRRFTQAAIEARAFGVVSKCFEIATAGLIEGDNGLRNAIYVSFLEHLDLRGDAGKKAKELMPSRLKQGRDEILDYDEQVLGQKRPEDDR